MKAKFTVVSITDDAVYLHDSGGKFSITNDAEDVLKHIKHTYGSRMRCIYRDSFGVWTEILDKPSENWMGVSPITFKIMENI